MVVSVGIRRVMSFCLAFLLTVSVLPCCFAPAAFAEEDGASFYAVPSSATLSTDRKTLVENYSEEKYYPFEGADEVKNGTYRGRPALISAPRETNDGAFYLAYEEPKDLSAYNELYFQLRIDGAAGKCSVQITFSSEGSSYDVKGSFDTGETYDVYCPVASFGERAATDHIYFYYSSDPKIDSVTVSALYADERFTYSHIERFSADSFSVDSENVISEKSISISPSAGACSLEAKRLGSAHAGQTVISRVAVSGVETGTLTLYVKNSGTADYSDISTINLFPGNNSYTFIYDVSKGNDLYMLSFSGAECTDGSSLFVNSVSFTYYDEKIEDTSEQYPASISSCSVSSDGKSVSVKGTVASNFVVSNIDGKIGIAAEDMWGESDPVIVADAGMSTMFDMKFSSADVPSLPYLCKYSVVLLGGEEGKFEYESSAVFPAAPSGAVAGTRSALGVEADDTSAPFDSDASYTVFEVDLDKLMTDDPASGRFHSYAGSYYYLNTSYLSEIEPSLGFYLRSGLKVYVRIVAGSGESGVYGCPDAAGSSSVMKYAAAVDYITEKYPSVFGLIVGCRINSFKYNRSDKEDLFLYAKNYADYLRVVSSAAKSNNPSCIVTVPFGDGYIYESGKIAAYDPVTGVGGDMCDPIMLSVLISKFLSVGGGVQWYMMYECESDPIETEGLLSRAVSRLVQNVGSAPAGHILYWRPDTDFTVEDLSALSEGADFTSHGTKSFIVSLIGKSVGPETTAALKNIDPNGSRGGSIVYANAVPSGDVSTEGHVFIKDFRRSYGTGEFFSGGTVTALTTEKSGAMSDFEGRDGDRALHAAGDGSGGGNGVVMATFDTPVSFAHADDLNVALCVCAESDDDLPVKIVFGDGIVRYEYTYTASSGVPVLLKCALDDTDISATYIALEVSSSSPYTADISRITISRDDGNKAAMREDQTENGEAKDHGSLITSLIAVGVFTLAAFAFLSIKGDKDRKESGIAQESKERKSVRANDRNFK